MVVGEKVEVVPYGAGGAVRSPRCTVCRVLTVQLIRECTVPTTSLSCVLQKVDLSVLLFLLVVLYRVCLFFLFFGKVPPPTLTLTFLSSP